MNFYLSDFLTTLWINSQAMLTNRLLPAVLLALVGIWAVKMVMKILNKVLDRTGLEKAAYSLIKSVVAVAMYALLALMVASRLGIDVTGIIALASVLTLAVSLAVQNMLTNVFGGFTLLSTKSFRSGDYVEIAGQGGTVKEIGLAYTKLVTPDNKVISIPNSAVTAAQIVNYSTSPTRRVDFNVTASYDAPLERTMEALLEAAKVPGVLEEPAPFVGVTQYGDHAISYVLRVWTENANYWNVNFAINQKIKEEFDKAGVEMTYPHLNVHLDK